MLESNPSALICRCTQFPGSSSDRYAYLISNRLGLSNELLMGLRRSPAHH